MQARPSPVVGDCRRTVSRAGRGASRRQRRQLLGPDAIGGQLVPAQQEGAVDQVVVERPAALLGQQAGHQRELCLGRAVAAEQLEGIGAIAEPRQDGLERDLGEQVLGLHLAAKRHEGPAPGSQRELLRAREAAAFSGGRVQRGMVSHECLLLICRELRAVDRRAHRADR